MWVPNWIKSLRWKSLFRASRSRLRRHRPNFVPTSLTAEVLEQRTLLSNNVTAALSGTALALTSDTGANSVNVYRLNASQVEIDGVSGTTINGVASVTFALSSVSGITVNLGSGDDTYHIFSAAGKPALNIGTGGILFEGASGGGTGDQLAVYNDSSNAMTIGGNITVQGHTSGSELAHSGSTTSEFDLYTGSNGNLTVNGSVSADQSGSGSGAQSNEIDTDGAGTLRITGAVTQTQTETGSGTQENLVETNTNGSGALTIGKGVTQSATGGTDVSNNEIITLGNGSLSISGGVTQTGSDADAVHNAVAVYNLFAGSITINGSVAQNATGTGTAKINDAVELEFESSGSITVSGSITQNAKGTGTATIQNIVGAASSSAGSISVGFGSGTGGITQEATGTGTATPIEDIVATASSGNLVVASGGITINESAQGNANRSNHVYTDSTGSLSTTGRITIKTNNSGSSSSDVTENDVDTAGGTGKLSALGVSLADSGSQTQDNYIQSNIGAVTIGSSGVSITGSGSGPHSDDIQTFTSTSSLTINGAVSVTETTTGSQDLDIAGVFFGSTVTISMNGSGAQLFINNGAGFRTTEFTGLFTATMLGSSPQIVVANGSGSRYSRVKFDAGLSLTGQSGAGATLTYKAANVSFTSLMQSFFTVVVT